MVAVSESTLLVGLIVVQVAGLVSLACARVAGNVAGCGLFRAAFLCCLVAVGLATMFAVGHASGWWVSCGTTLAVMSVGGTIDCGRASPAAF